MKALALLLATAVLAPPAEAGTITITISQTARLADGTFSVDVKVGNSGDEAALSVTPVLRFGDQEVRGKGKASLAPNSSFDETLSLPVGTLGDGRWPYRLAVDYTDQNQYPFQALQTQTFVVGNPPPAKVAVPAIRSEEVTGTGSLSVTVNNLTPDPRAIRVSVLVPEGLEATDAVRQVNLEGWKDATLKVPITNRTALVDSRYPVFVAAEYDDGPVHQAVVAQGVVAVTEPESFLTRNRHLLTVVAGAVVLGWLAVVLSRALRR
jgi:hypothetical protein